MSPTPHSTSSARRRRRGPSAGRLPALLVVAIASASFVAAQGTSCGSGFDLCPDSAPCCSEYGWCGSSALFCSQGCNPLWSHNPQSCAPLPLCVDQTSIFADLSRVQPNATLWNGNASAYDWVVNQGSFLTTGDEGVLTLTQDGGGTKISSTRYVHYGKISATLKTSSAVGVVTAFITMSDTKDEIDIEMPGAARDSFQTNWFGLGVANYTDGRSATISGLNDTRETYHTYALDWTEDVLTWLVDDEVKETLWKNDTLSADGLWYQYPSTPSRVQLSIWPAGINTSAQGTIDWAGGNIDWTSEEYLSAGYYRVLVDSVSIECRPAADEPVNASTISYQYALDGNGTEGKPYTLASEKSPLISAADGGRLSAARPTVVVFAGAAFLLAAVL